MFKVFVGFLLTAGMVPFFMFDPGHFPTALKMTEDPFQARWVFGVSSCGAGFFVGPEKGQRSGVQKTSGTVFTFTLHNFTAQMQVDVEVVEDVHETIEKIMRIYAYNLQCRTPPETAPQRSINRASGREGTSRWLIIKRKHFFSVAGSE